jgi:uncharacterized PurR-regulated membrane protein YhhQ (DUF165 family)
MTRRTRLLLGSLAVLGFVACVVGANLAIRHWHTFTILGLVMPAGVAFAGMTFSLRDAIREYLHPLWLIPALLAGTLLSWIMTDAVQVPGAPLSLALASGLAFALSESIDTLVYEPLRHYYENRIIAVVGSNIVGLVVDSLLFLWLAFGNVDLLAGQIVGKVAMTVPVIGLMWAWRRDAFLLWRASAIPGSAD